MRIKGMRWAPTTALAMFIACALGLLLWATSPRAPPSSFVGPSAVELAQGNEHATYLRFLEHLKHIAGPGAKDCGALALRDTNEGVLTCGVNALAKRTSFWLAIEFQGVDSAMWTGLVQDARGNGYRIEFGSDANGGVVSLCSSLSINPRATERELLFSCPVVAVP